MEHVSSVRPTGKFPEKLENLKRWARLPGWNFRTECRVPFTFLVVCTSSRSTVGHRHVPGFSLWVVERQRTNTRARSSPVGIVTRVHMYRSLYYPWGKKRTAPSVWALERSNRANTRAHVPRRLGLSRALACIVHSIIHEVRKGLLLVCEYLRSQGIGKVQNLLCEFFSRWC